MNSPETSKLSAEELGLEATESSASHDIPELSPEAKEKVQTMVDEEHTVLEKFRRQGNKFAKTFILISGLTAAEMGCNIREQAQTEEGNKKQVETLAAQEERAESFKQFWQDFTSVKENPKEWLEEHKIPDNIQGRILNNYSESQARLDTLLESTPEEDLAEFFASKNVDPNSWSSKIRNTKIFPSSTRRAEHYSYTDPNLILVNPFRYKTSSDERERLKLMRILVHEMGHGLSRGTGLSYNRNNEGFMDLGAWAFQVEYLKKRIGGDVKQLREQLSKNADKSTYFDRFVISAFHSKLYLKEDPVKLLYSNKKDLHNIFRQSLKESRRGASPYPHSLFNEILMKKGHSDADKPEMVPAYLYNMVGMAGFDRVATAHEELKRDLQFDIAVKGLKVEDNMVYLDHTRTEKKESLVQRQGQCYLTLPNGRIVELSYRSSSKGHESFSDVVSTIRHIADETDTITTHNWSRRIYVDQTVSFIDDDGLLRPELREILQLSRTHVGEQDNEQPAPPPHRKNIPERSLQSGIRGSQL